MTTISQAHLDFVKAVGTNPPQEIPVFPFSHNFEDRAEYIEEFIGQVRAYLLLLAVDTECNAYSNLHLRCRIEAAVDDLAGDLAGSIRQAGPQ